MLTFSPVIFFSYAFSDDWSTFFDAITRNGSSFQWDVQSGRPVYAVFRYYGQMLINDISSFSYLRLFNILSLVVLSGFIYNFIDSRKIFDNPVFKVIFPLLICSLPAFQVYASWATCFRSLFQYCWQVLVIINVSHIRSSGRHCQKNYHPLLFYGWHLQYINRQQLHSYSFYA